MAEQESQFGGEKSAPKLRSTEESEAENLSRDPIKEFLKLEGMSEEEIVQFRGVVFHIQTFEENPAYPEWRRIADEIPMSSATYSIPGTLDNAIAIYLRQESAVRHPDGDMLESRAEMVCHTNLLQYIGWEETADMRERDPVLKALSKDSKVKATIDAYWESLGGPIKYFDANGVIREKGIQPFQLAQKACNEVFTFLTEHYPQNVRSTLFLYQAAQKQFDEGWRWDSRRGEFKQINNKQE